MASLYLQLIPHFDPSHESFTVELLAKEIQPGHVAMKDWNPVDVGAEMFVKKSKLGSHLGTRVTIETRRNGQRGRIIIEFQSLDEFDRITEQIGIDVLEEV